MSARPSFESRLRSGSGGIAFSVRAGAPTFEVQSYVSIGSIDCPSAGSVSPWDRERGTPTSVSDLQPHWDARLTEFTVRGSSIGTTPSGSTSRSVAVYPWSSRLSAQHPTRPDSWKPGPENGVRVRVALRIRWDRRRLPRHRVVVQKVARHAGPRHGWPQCRARGRGDEGGAGQPHRAAAVVAGASFGRRQPRSVLQPLRYVRGRRVVPRAAPLVQALDHGPAVWLVDVAAVLELG